MNANELADELDIHVSMGQSKFFKECATMLRQQQALIENLNGRIGRMIENASHHEGIAHAGGFEQGYEAGRKMGMQQERALWNLSESTQEIMNTQPADLTDGQIMQVWWDSNDITDDDTVIEFARAILRKAQEK